ncbi:MAG TPA: hypothetical protein VNK49_08620 [Anaerolineales bacterium]|nr:hypothetical protein [Anaerolineales bacterium]
MNFNFGEVLTRAWQIIWKHKILWVFGILTGCQGGWSGGGGGRGGEGGFRELDNRLFERIAQWISENMWVVVVVAILFILLILLFIFLSAIGRIALIKGTYKAERGAERLVFGELFSESMPYFWRVFGLSWLIGLAFLLVLSPFIVLSIFFPLGMACLVPMICVLIPIALVVGIIIEQAIRGIVLENLGIVDSLRRGWEVFRTNLGVVILMTILLGLISVTIGSILALPLLIALIPLVIGIASGNNASLWMAGLCFLAYLPVLLVLNGILMAYIHSAWTLTYMRLTQSRGTTPQMIEANA